MSTTSTKRMEPEEAIENVAAITRRIDEIRAHLSDEADQLAEEWAGIGAAGGQRADHAAMLLGRLRPHLAELEQFAAACRQQITDMVANPFGRNQ